MGNSVNFQALNFNVVVEHRVLENKTASGFDLSGYVDANENQQSGVVVSIGELCPKDSDGNHYIKIGDMIVFGKHKASSLTNNGKNYLIVPYPDLVLSI